MTSQDIIKHWKKGAKDALDLALYSYNTKKYELCLFHCHLALEKTLKALFIEQKDEAPPKTHDLTNLLEQIVHSLDENDINLMKDVNQFCIEFRYSDPHWAEVHATEDRTKAWLDATHLIFSKLLP